MWKIIRSKQDINNFMTLFGGFHDACLKEIRYTSGAFVNKDLFMNPVNSERLLYAIFQRQGFCPTTIELKFIGLKRVNLVPQAPNYDALIQNGNLAILQDCVIWYDCECLDDISANTNHVIAERLEWRTADEWVGSDNIYVTTQQNDKSINQNNCK